MKKSTTHWFIRIMSAVLLLGMLAGCAAQGTGASHSTGGNSGTQTGNAESSSDSGAGATDSSAAEVSHMDSVAGSSPVETGQGVAEVLSVKYPVEQTNELPDPAMLEAVRKFGMETSCALLGGAENTLYSPLSLYFALALAEEGANGETLTQMRALLGADQVEDFAAQCGLLFRSLCVENADQTMVLRIANSLWMQQGHAFGQEYLDNVQNNLFASLYQADFMSEETGEAIGRWVSENTGGMLEYAYTPDPEQIMSILNTVWLKGAWTEPFIDTMNYDGPFKRADNTEVTVPFMYKYDSHTTIYYGEGFTRAELGIRGLGRMVFVLPDEGAVLSDLFADEATLNEALHGGEANAVDIRWHVPKYDSKSTLALGKYLQKKIPAAFADSDFTRMTPENATISGVTQKTRIHWDEEGVEAAAYTEVTMATATAIAVEPPVVEFKLDRPFLYGVQSHDGVDLFVGACYDPSAE